MKNIAVYLKLFRWQNLLVVFLTMVLFRYAIILPVLNTSGLQLGLSHFNFALLVISTLLISAAGYAINDYFDLRIDRINKPERIILGKQIPRRKAIFFHWLFNTIALFLGGYIAYLSGKPQYAIAFVVIPFLLWLYSVRYKKKFFVGNLVVASLAAFVILIVWAFDLQFLLKSDTGSRDIYRVIDFFALFYASFAFLTTLVREIIKDAEDVEGDRKAGCKTIAAFAGLKASRRFAASILLLSFSLVAYIQWTLAESNFLLLQSYITVFVQLPFIFLIYKTVQSKTRKDFKLISHKIKFVMITGIFSMLIFAWYLSEGLQF